MTEAEWLACADPEPMLLHLVDKGSDRKLRLIAVACCRRLWPQYKDERSRAMLEMAERYADRQASEEEYSAAYHAAGQAEEADEDPKAADSVVAASYDPYFWRSPIGNPFGLYSRPLAKHAERASDGVASHVADEATNPGLPLAEYNAAWQARYAEELSCHCVLLRDIIGNPFRPVQADPRWLTPEVVALAQAIYEQRTFDRMPQLAALLRGAGCDHQEILDHLSGPGPHARGCWALDLLTGRS